MTRCYLALGGNVGDVEGHFQEALTGLGRHPGTQVVRLSSMLRTKPVGACAGGEFVNAAAAIETDLDPFTLLDRLQDLERHAGRVPTGTWRPRPLDIDLIFYGDEIIATERLQVPHPACWYRRFVLDPLAEIAADVRHPVKNVTVAELRDRLLPRPLCLAVSGGSESRRRHVVTQLDGVPHATVQEWLPNCSSISGPAILAWLGDSTDSAAPSIPFEALPLVPRLDVSAVQDPAAFLGDVLRAALG